MPLELDAQLSELDFLSEKQEGLFRARAALVRRRAATPPGSAEMADIGRQINRIVASIDRVNDRIEFLGNSPEANRPFSDDQVARLREAAPTHLRGVEEYVMRRLSPVELDALGRLLRKLLPEADAVADAGHGPAVVEEAG